MTKYLNFFESESGFTEAVEAGQLYYPNVSYTEDDDTVHWKAQSADPVETPMLRMHFSTSTPGQKVALRNHRVSGVTAIEIDGTPVDIVSSGGTYSIESPGSHTAVYQFSSSMVPVSVFWGASGQFDAFTSAEITSAVTSIGHGAFENCGGLTSVSIPDSVTAIGDGVFEDSGLRYLTIKDTVTWLGAYSFKGCAQMGSARIGSGITSIPSLEFADCTSLQSVTLPGNLMQINDGAFSGCSSLHDISIPSGVRRIGHHAFMGCSGLTAVYFNSQVPPLLEGSAFTATNDCPIYVPVALVETYQQAWPEYASRIRPMYNITTSLNDSSLGEVNVLKNAPEGAHVDFDVNVFDSDGYQVSSVTVTDGNGDAVECTNDWDNHYSFTMPASDVTISVVIGEKQKHTVTVNSTDGLVTDVNFMSDDGEPSFGEDNMANFFFNLPEDLQLVSVQASDCDGNSIEVDLDDEGDGHYFCTFIMPGCDVSVFITVEADTRPEYNITASVNDEDLGFYNGPGSAPEGGHVEFDVVVFEPDANQVTSVTITDGNGDEVQVNDEGDNHYTFTMPASDVTISVVIRDKTPEYNITARVNDSSLGFYNGPSSFPEGGQVEFNVVVFDSDANQVTSVTVTDGNGDEVQVTNEFGVVYLFEMPASDVTISVVIEPKQ